MERNLSIGFAIVGSNRISLANYKSRNAERRHGCDEAFPPFSVKGRKFRDLGAPGQSNRPSDSNDPRCCRGKIRCEGPTRFFRGLQP